MARIWRKHSPEFKLKAVMEVLKGEKTATQLAGEFGVHPIVLSEWKKQFPRGRDSELNMQSQNSPLIRRNQFLIFSLRAWGVPHAAKVLIPKARRKGEPHETALLLLFRGESSA